MRKIPLVWLILISMSAISLMITVAQQPAPTCADYLTQFYSVATELCLTAPDNYVCNGGNAPLAEPAGPVSNSLGTLGAIVPLDALTSLRTSAFTADGSNGGLMWVRSEANQMRGILLGDALIRDVSALAPRWSNIILNTQTSSDGCFATPFSSFTFQATEQFEPIRLTINGAVLDVNGAIMALTTSTETVFIVIEGVMRVTAYESSQLVLAGQEIRLPYINNDFSAPASPPPLPAPYNPTYLVYFPIGLLDRPVYLPQPGYVITDARVNLRTGPSTRFEIIYEVPSGQIMTILGLNPAGDWYHVRLANGQTGWMSAEFLGRNHGAIGTVYSNTPLPPQRYGELGNHARVTAMNGVVMRQAPDASFPEMLTVPVGTNLELLARSPYSPWVKVSMEGVVGWVALLALDTQAIVEALPIDGGVPTLEAEVTVIPYPTVIFGGAFPDPRCYPNC
ncbi:MAG: SH3 domain-containing protein [Anaerolineae bacterium]|jgi:uncharacterized protein YraI|nr:SH3 domain-containing protein [Anaerolineae bacterium]